MNWISYANKRKDGISKREQEWFAKREAENKNIQLEIPNEYSKNGGRPRNLDLQRIYNFPARRKAGRLSINKINLERANTKYCSVDLDKNILDNHRPKRNAYDSFKYGYNDSCAGKSCISTSSTFRANEKPKSYHKSQKAYNYIETLEDEEDHKRIDDEENDQPFFLKYEDLRKVASLKKRNDSSVANKNESFDQCTVITDCRNITIRDTKRIGTLSQMRGQPCKAWNGNKIFHQDEAGCSRNLDYVEPSFNLPCKGSKVVTFSDRSPNFESICLNDMQRNKMNQSLTSRDFLKFNKNGMTFTGSQECPRYVSEMKCDDEKLKHSDLSCGSSSCKSEDIVEISNQHFKRPHNLIDYKSQNDAYEVNGSDFNARDFNLKQDCFSDSVESVSQFRRNVEPHDFKILNSKTNDVVFGDYYSEKEVCIPNNELMFEKSSFTNNIMDSNSEEVTSALNINNNNNNNNKNNNNNNNNNCNDDYFGKHRHFLFMNQRHAECQTDSTFTNPPPSCQAISNQKKMVDASTNTSQNHDNATAGKEFVTKHHDKDDGDDDNDDAVLDLSLKANHHKIKDDDKNKEDGINHTPRVCSSDDCPRTCISGSCLPAFVKDLLQQRERALLTGIGVDKPVGENIFEMKDIRTASVMQNSKPIELKVMSSEQCLDDIFGRVNDFSQESSLYESPLGELM